MTAVRVKPDELVLASVEGFGAAFRSLGVNERQANSDDFEGLAVYLASDRSSFHTAQAFVIDGGYANS